MNTCKRYHIALLNATILSLCVFLCEQPETAKKNRYSNSLPFDHSRVILNDLANVSGTDYINASTIVSAFQFMALFGIFIGVKVFGIFFSTFCDCIFAWKTID